MEIVKISHLNSVHLIFDMNYIIHLERFDVDFVRENENSVQIHFERNHEHVERMNQLNNRDVYYFDLWNQHEQ